MQLLGKFQSISKDFKTNKYKVTFLIEDNEAIKKIDEIRSVKRLSIDVKRWHKKRTLDANAYAWTLINKLAEKMNLTSIEVYRKAIRELGICEIFPVKNEAVERYIAAWGKNGIGWVCDKMKSKLKGYTNVVSYYGSSSYDTREMSRFIDGLIEDCRALEIEILSEENLDSMKREWGT